MAGDGPSQRASGGGAPIDVSVVDSVATVTLNRPSKKNALSIALRDAVADAVDALAIDPSVKVIVITGAGDTFSAGFDLPEFADRAIQRELWASSDRFHHTVLRCPIPTIAAVNGAALAGGFDLACLCDIRIAADTARFGHPEQSWAPVLYRTLHDLVGGATARDLALSGRTIDAHEAHALGLVVAVTPPDALMTATTEHAQRIARSPREHLLATKAKILAVSSIPPDTPTLDI